MTKLGPNIIKKCPSCSGLFSQQSYASYNNFGAEWWTDGTVVGLMRPSHPEAGTCPHCMALIWIYEAEKVGEAPSIEGRHVSEWSRLQAMTPQSYGQLTKSICNKALKSTKGLTEEKEIYLRFQYWYLANEISRRCNIPLQFSIKVKRNLRALLRLVEGTEDQGILFRAEIYRQLGDFKESIKLLNYEFKNEYVTSAATIYKYATLGDSMAQKIQRDPAVIDAWRNFKNRGVNRKESNF